MARGSRTKTGEARCVFAAKSCHLVCAGQTDATAFIAIIACVWTSYSPEPLCKLAPLWNF